MYPLPRTIKMAKKETTSAKENINKTVSMAILDSYRNALYSVKGFFDKAGKDLSGIEDIELQLKVAKGICELGEKLGKNIESLDKLEEKVQKEEKLALNRRGGEKTSLFED